MKDVRYNSTDEFEPTVSHGSPWLAMWIIGLLALLVFVGFTYVNVRGGEYNELVYEPYLSTNQLASFVPKDEFAELMAKGKIAYDTYCANCHQASGVGAAGVAPPLAGSEWVITPGANRLARIPLRGLQGPIKVKGVDYNMSMLAIGATMTDEQVAAVLTYIRNSWGNKAPLVTVEQVGKVQGAIKDHPEMFTADELLKLPEQIP
jgi:mono/diheme cytochrome c family protein